MYFKNDSFSLPQKHDKNFLWYTLWEPDLVHGSKSHESVGSFSDWVLLEFFKTLRLVHAESCQLQFRFSYLITGYCRGFCSGVSVQLISELYLSASPIFTWWHHFFHRSKKSYWFLFCLAFYIVRGSSDFKASYDSNWKPGISTIKNF